MKTPMKVVWVSADGYTRTMDELGMDNLVNILNMIERGALSQTGRIRTATYKDLVKEAIKRGLTHKTAKVWSKYDA